MKVVISVLIGIFSIALFKGINTDHVVKQPTSVNYANPTIDSVVVLKRELLSEKQYFSNGMIVKKEGFNLQNQLMYRYSYRNGLKHGTWEEYYENGKLYLKMDYFNGKRNGSQKVYYSDGNFQYWVEWINDMELSRLDYPRPSENVQVSPGWKGDGC